MSFVRTIAVAIFVLAIPDPARFDWLQFGLAVTNIRQTGFYAAVGAAAALGLAAVETRRAHHAGWVAAATACFALSFWSGTRGSVVAVVAAVAAWLFMNNLTGAKSSPREQLAVVRYHHTWVMSFLYIGTFGSFIGFGFAFGQVLQVQFKGDFSTPVKAAYLTFLGPLLGSLIRPVGGALADRIGGAKVTFWNFVAMAVSASVVLAASLAKSLPLFLVGFIALFVFSGVGNGSA